MQVQMQNAERISAEQIRGFLEGSEGMEFRAASRQEAYEWIQAVLVEQEYLCQRRRQRGAIRGYLNRATGLSMPQVTRLIRQYAQTGSVEWNAGRRYRFAVKYTAQDVGLLAAVDRAHRLSGPATRRILEREFRVYGKAEFERLAGISVGHLYNLRHSVGYRQHGVRWEQTRPSQVGIAERRKPEPGGRPGFLRVDTVHQGDWDGSKGVYHINAVDTVTQWQVVGCASKISHQYLLPVLESMWHQFPFRILGFHADNGTEFINYEVSKMLKELLVDFTKSRACRSQDNALVEGKNGAVIRKHIGYGHIGSEHAEALGQFYRKHLNPYLNFHRPCGFATVTYDQRGKRMRRYRLADYRTPLEKLEEIAAGMSDTSWLKAGVSVELLKQMAGRMSDTECAVQLSAAREQVLRQCKVECPVPPPGW